MRRMEAVFPTIRSKLTATTVDFERIIKIICKFRSVRLKEDLETLLRCCLI